MTGILGDKNTITKETINKNNNNDGYGSGNIGMKHLAYVVKKNGERQEFKPEKINKWVEWACEGTSASWSYLVNYAVKKIYDGSTTADIQKAIVDSAVELVKTDLDYDVAAKRIFLAALRKEVFGQFNPPPFREFYHMMVSAGHWKDMDYTDEQLDYLDSRIDHNRDFNFSYGGLKQAVDKYLLSKNGKPLETPQFMYMGIAMAGLYDSDIEEVADMYDDFSLFMCNLPTPVLAGYRTPYSGAASCCVIRADDSAQSINAAINIAYTMTANRAGIGIEFNIRSENDPVRGGLFEHLGKLPYYRLLDRTVKSMTQQSRGGSATIQYNIFDPEIETLLRLKSQRISSEKRIDKVDYSLAVNDFFIRKLINKEDIMLVSVYYAPRLYELFFSKDLDAFIDEYHRVENDDSIPKKFVKAVDIWGTFFQQRLDTGRIYAHRVDESNRRSMFKDPIISSNLCLEILEPTKAFDDPLQLYQYEYNGEVALCNLGGIVCGRVPDDRYEALAYRLVKFIDNIIESQEYPYPAIEYTAKRRRNIGIGLINVAHAIAKNGLSYESLEGRNFIHREMEKFSYFLHKASIRLAKERGTCEWFDKTRYSEGLFPMDLCPKTVEEVHTEPLHYDWDALREDLKRYGMRNSILEANMPSETSSVLIGATNGCEPIRSLFTYKASGVSTIPFIAPDAKELADKYELAFDIDNKRYAEFIAIMQKFIGQSISYNEYYDYNKYPNGIIPLKEVIANWIYAAKLGVKTWYYLNTDVDNGGAASQAVNREVVCEGGACTL